MITLAPLLFPTMDHVAYVEALQEITSRMVSRAGDLKEDARRIVACVNACEGLSQHYLETLHPSHSSLAREMAILRNKMEAAERERDEMRAALVKIGDEKLSKYASVDDYAGFVGGVINEALGESL